MGAVRVISKFFEVKRVSVKKKVWFQVSGPVAALRWRRPFVAAAAAPARNQKKLANEISACAPGWALHSNACPYPTSQKISINLPPSIRISGT
jgi:hypothetical protein